MIDTYAWNREFRQRIIALCLYSNWFARFGVAIIQPEFFELECEQDIVSSILKFYVNYKRSPDCDELSSMHEDDEDAQELIEKIYDYEYEQLEYAEQSALQFAREQAMKLAILESVEDIQEGNLSKPLTRVKDALEVGVDLKDVGISLKDDHSWAYEEVLEDKIQTGIMHLDMMLDGGLARGELGVVMAGPNVGKTMALVNFGCGAATIMGKCNVAHVTCELSANKVAKRYAARTVFGWLRKEDDPSEYIMDFRNAARVLMPGSVYIREFPAGSATVQDIASYLERLSVADTKIDLLIVDYADEMRHANVGEYRHNVANTFMELRALAQVRHIPVWTATQTHRSALGKPMVNLDNVAESFDKVRKADVVLAMCQTDVELEDHMLRFYAAKIRDGKGGWMVRCFIDEEAHSIISDEVISISKLLKELNDRKKSENN